MTRHTVYQLGLILGMIQALIGCAGSTFQVKTDPPEAEVFVEIQSSGEKKSIGKTPIEMSKASFKEIAGDEVVSGEFYNLIIEKKGFLSVKQAVPATRFGTLLTSLDVKMKAGDDPRQLQVATEILDHLYVAQKLAQKKEYERAQIELDKIILTHPEFARALTLRASIYYIQGKYKESVKWYDEALKVDPKMEEAIRMLAKAKQGAGK